MERRRVFSVLDIWYGLFLSNCILLLEPPSNGVRRMNFVRMLTICFQVRVRMYGSKIHFISFSRVEEINLTTDSNDEGLKSYDSNYVRMQGVNSGRD